MGMKAYISKNYRDKYTASSKAKLDAERIVAQNGYVNIGLSPKSIQNQFLGRIYTILSNILGYLRMPKNGDIFIQYPVNFCGKQVARAKQRNNKVTVLIHDLNSLRQLDMSSLDPLMKADRVIAHTSAMKKWLVEKNINKNIEILRIFDYLDNTDAQIPDTSVYRIAFAGNLGKSKFLNKLEGSDNVEYRLFGVGVENLKLNSGVTFEGCYAPDQLAKHLDSHFGLVWDGDSLKECNGVNGEYLKYISPHKLSMYLSAGLPVIVWKDSAMADFVKEEGIGLVVSSLENIPYYLKNLSRDQYTLMQDRAKKIGHRLLKGSYLITALEQGKKSRCV